MDMFSKQEELILLSVYTLKDSAYLVTIREYLHQNADKDWAFGSLYIALERLRKKGFVQTYIGEPSRERGGKAIKYYSLTPGGIAALKETKKVQDTMWREFSENLFGAEEL